LGVPFPEQKRKLPAGFSPDPGSGLCRHPSGAPIPISLSRTVASAVTRAAAIRPLQRGPHRRQVCRWHRFRYRRSRVISSVAPLPGEFYDETATICGHPATGAGDSDDAQPTGSDMLPQSPTCAGGTGISR